MTIGGLLYDFHYDANDPDNHFDYPCDPQNYGDHILPPQLSERPNNFLLDVDWSYGSRGRG